MNKSYQLKTTDVEVLNKISEMVNYTKAELTKNTIYKNKLSPKQAVVISMFGAVNSYTEAIFELCKQGRPEAGMVILRSIIEAWINSNYILSHPNDKLIWLFAIEDSYYRKSLMTGIEKYYDSYPKKRSIHHPKEKLEKLATLPEKEIENFKSKYDISFKNKKEFKKAWGSLRDRAKRVDKRLKKRQKENAGGLEHTYILVYKYFSEYTHLQMRGLEHFWKKDERGDTLILDKNPLQITHVLVTSYLMYLYFASKLKQYKLIDGSLSKYDTYFNNKLVKTIEDGF